MEVKSECFEHLEVKRSSNLVDSMVCFVDTCTQAHVQAKIGKTDVF